MSAEEKRKAGETILAADAVEGFWYNVPSGEIERCVGARNRGRGVQVGFVGIGETAADPEDIRWIQGKAPIHVANELDAARLMVSMREREKGGPAPDLAFEHCPRNGLVCLECETPQRETPRGAVCEHGHGGAPGKSPEEVANALAEQGCMEEANAVLDSVPTTTTDRVNSITLPHQGGSLAKAPSTLQAVYREGSQEVIDTLGSMTGSAYAKDVAGIQVCVRCGHPNDDAHAMTACVDPSGLEGLAARTANALALAPSEGEDPDLQAGGLGMTPQEAMDTYANVKASVAEIVSPRVTPVYHKSLHIDWRTPKALFDAQVARWGPCWLDAAATKENKLCEYWLGPGSDVEDALTVNWLPSEEIIQEFGRNIWLNHPYSKGEGPCPAGCDKPKCAERGYHLDRRIASSGEWMMYARDQALRVLPPGGALMCLTKVAPETQWWKDAVRMQPREQVGPFSRGVCDPCGGPAARFMNTTPYKAATWLEFSWESGFTVDIVEIEGRVDFDRGGNDGSAGFPSAIVAFYKPGA